MVALPSVGFKVAAWLWLNGYSSADNSSLPTGYLRKLYNGTEYSFAELSMKIQQSNNGIESLFRYWKHALKVRLRLNVSTAVLSCISATKTFSTALLPFIGT